MNGIRKIWPYIIVTITILAIFISATPINTITQECSPENPTVSQVFEILGSRVIEQNMEVTLQADLSITSLQPAEEEAIRKIAKEYYTEEYLRDKVFFGRSISQRVVFTIQFPDRGLPLPKVGENAVIEIDSDVVKLSVEHINLTHLEIRRYGYCNNGSEPNATRSSSPIESVMTSLRRDIK